MNSHAFFNSEVEQSPHTIAPEMIMMVIVGCLSVSVLMIGCAIHYFCLQRDLDLHRSIGPAEPIQDETIVGVALSI